MQFRKNKKILSFVLSALLLFSSTSSIGAIPVLAEEPTPTPTATPELPVEDPNIQFEYNGDNLSFDETFDNSGKTNLPKDYSFTSDTSTVGYTVSKISLVGQAVRDEDEVTTLGNLSLGKVEGQKEDDSWVVLANFGNSATSTETIDINEEKDSLDTTTTFKAIKYSGLVDNSTDLTVDSYDSSKLKLEVEFMPVVTHKVTFIDDVDQKAVFTNVPDGFDIVESSITKPTHEGYDFNSFDGTLTNITADGEVHITYDIQQYDVKIHYNGTDVVNDTYNYGEKFTVLKKDGTTVDKEFINTSGIDEELTPITETGFDFVDFSYDDTTKTITPNYSVQTFTVTFVDLDGKTIGTPETVEYGKGATAPEAPEVDGYSFTKWDIDFSNVTANLTVKPIYDQIMLKVYVTSNSAVIIDEQLPWGAVISIMNGDKTLNKKIEVKQEINQDLPIPEWIGHTFSNWTPVDDGTGNKVLTPNFVINEYSVRFLDMDKNVLTTKRVKYGETVVAPTAPVVKGYIFTGWDKPLTGITEDCDIQANYNDDPSVPKYNITFAVRSIDRSYGTLSTSTSPTSSSLTIEKVVDGTLVSSIAPTLKLVNNSKFAGWYINGIKVDDFDTRTVDAIMTIEARFFPDVNANDIDDREEPVVVTFNSVGGSSVTEQNIYVGSVAVTPEAPTKSGYMFNGWYNSNSYATKWNFGDTILQDITLYAKWTKIVAPVVQTTAVPTVTNRPTTVVGGTTNSTVPVITSAPTVTSSTTGSTTLNTSGISGVNSNSSSTLTNATSKPVVTINPTLYVHPTISFLSYEGFPEGTETMPYGTNIYVYNGYDELIAEYSARQDGEITLEEPGLIKDKVFSGYNISKVDGSVIVKYEYLNDYSNGPIESADATASASADTGNTIPTTQKTNDWKWMIPYILGGVGILALFGVIIAKVVLKKDDEEDLESPDDETDSESNEEEADVSNEDDGDFEESEIENEDYDEEENHDDLENDEDDSYDEETEYDEQKVPLEEPVVASSVINDNKEFDTIDDAINDESESEEDTIDLINQDDNVQKDINESLEIDDVNNDEVLDKNADAIEKNSYHDIDLKTESDIKKVGPDVNIADNGTVTVDPVGEDKYEALLKKFKTGK